MMDKEKTETEIDHWCVVCDRQILPTYTLVQPDPVGPVDVLTTNDTIGNLTKATLNLANNITAYTTAEATQAKNKSKPKLTLAGGPPKALKSTASANAKDENASTPSPPALNNVTLSPALPKKRGSVVGAGNKGGFRPGLHRSRTATGYGYATMAATAAAATKRKSTQTAQGIPSPNRDAAPTDEVERHEHHERQEPLMNGGITASPLENESIANVADLNAVDHTSPGGRKARTGSGADTTTTPVLRRGYSERQLPKDGGNQLLPFEKLPRKINLAPMEGDPPAPPHNSVLDEPEITRKAQSKLKAKSKLPKSPLSPRYASKPTSPIVLESIAPPPRPQEVYDDPGKRLYCSEECRTIDILEKQRRTLKVKNSDHTKMEKSPSVDNLLYDMPWMESRMYNFTRIHSPTAASSRAPTRPASSTSLFNGLDDERFTTVRAPPIGAMWSFEKEEEEKRRKRYSQPLPLSRLGSSTTLNMSSQNYGYGPPGYGYIQETPNNPWNHLDAYRSLPVSPGSTTRPLSFGEDDEQDLKKDRPAQLQFRRIPGAYSSVHHVDHPIPRTRSYLSAGSPPSSKLDRHSKQKKRRSLMTQFDHLGQEYFPEGESGVRGRERGVGEDQDWPTFLAAADQDPTLNYEDWKEYRQRKRMELTAAQNKAPQPTAEEEEFNRKWQKMPHLIRAASQPTIYHSHHAQPVQQVETLQPHEIRTRFRRAPSKSSSRSRNRDPQPGTSARTTSSISSPLEMKKALPLPSSPCQSRPAHNAEAQTDKAQASGLLGPTSTNSPVLEASSPSHLAMESSAPTFPNDPDTSAVSQSQTQGSSSPSISERRRAKNPSLPLFTDNIPSTTSGSTGTGTTAANNPNRLSLTGLPPMRSPLGLYSVNAEEAAAAAIDSEGSKEATENGEPAVAEKIVTKPSSSVPRLETSILSGNLRALQPLVIKAHIAVKCPPTSTVTNQKVRLPTLTTTIQHGVAGEEKSAFESDSPTLVTAISGSGSSGHSSMSRSAEARHEMRRASKHALYTTLPSDFPEPQLQLAIDMNMQAPMPSSTMPAHGLGLGLANAINDSAFPTPAQASLSKAYLDHLGSVPDNTMFGKWRLTFGGRDGQIQPQTQTQVDTQGEKRRSLWGIFGSVKH